MYEFDFKTFMSDIRQARRQILRNCGIAAVVALVVAFSIPKEYESSVNLAPEMTEEGGTLSSGGLSSLASLAGINLGGGVDAIRPDLYPDVITTNDFIIDLLDTPIETVAGDSLSFEAFMRQSRDPWWSFITKVPGKLLKMIMPKPQRFNTASEDGRINPQRVTLEEEELLEGVRGSVSCFVSERTGVISLTVRSQDPLVSQLMVDTVTSHLQNFITAYRTSKARTDFDYYTNLEHAAQGDLDSAIHRYATYSDNHTSAILQRYISERDRLENEVNIAQTAYNQLAQQRQLAAAKVQERTPAFTILQASTVANRASSPRKLFILIAFVFLAFCGTVGWRYYRLLYSKT